MTTDLAASIRQKLLNHARDEQVDFQQVLGRFGMERLLYRLSQSAEHRQLILKGAMLFELWFNSAHRPTRDLDFLAFGEADTKSVMECFRRFLSLPVQADDGIVFDLGSLGATEIRKNAGYPGIRVKLKAHLDGAVIAIQCDLGFGDVVTPAPIVSTYPTLLDLSAPQLLTYPQATVIAEKMEAIVKLGERNSRIKDYFDLWILLRQNNLSDPEVVQAIAATFERRRTAIPQSLPEGFSPQFAAPRSRQWQEYVKRNRLQAPDFATVVAALGNRCWPLFQQAFKQSHK